MAKKTAFLQNYKTTTIADDYVIIPVVGRWNLIAIEAKYDGYPCLGAIWYEPAQKSGIWGSVTAIGLKSNPHFASPSHIVWHGKLPLQDDSNNRIIVGLDDGEIGSQLSLSILLEEK